MGAETLISSALAVKAALESINEVIATKSKREVDRNKQKCLNE